MCWGSDFARAADWSQAMAVSSTCSQVISATGECTVARQNYIPPPRRPHAGRSRKGNGRYDIPVLSRVWVSTVDLGAQSYPGLDFALCGWW